MQIAEQPAKLKEPDDDGMMKVMEGRTTLMIAHRLSTLEVCDARLVIEHGHLVEATGHIHMDVPKPAASGASGQR